MKKELQRARSYLAGGGRGTIGGNLHFASGRVSAIRTARTIYPPLRIYFILESVGTRICFRLAQMLAARSAAPYDDKEKVSRRGTTPPFVVVVVVYERRGSSLFAVFRTTRARRLRRRDCAVWFSIESISRDFLSGNCALHYLRHFVSLYFCFFVFFFWYCIYKDVRWEKGMVELIESLSGYWRIIKKLRWHGFG